MKPTKLMWTVFSSLVIAALLLAACSPAAPAPTQVSDSGVERVRIAVVLPGKPNDYGISHGVYDALVAYRDKLGADVVELAVSENNFVVENAAAAIRDYASQGFDIVVAPSSAFGSALQEIAPDFPNTSFVWGTTPDTFGLPNVYAFLVDAKSSGYVLGVIAATEYDKVAMVLPLNVGSIAGTAAGFEAGFKTTKPNGELLTTFTGAFGDITLANQAARTMADAGVQMILSQTEIGTGAATVAKERGLPFMGVNENFAPFAPEVTIASADFHYEAVLHPIFDQVRAGQMGGEMHTLTLDNGGLEIVYNLSLSVSDAARRAAEQATDGLKSGSITLP